MREEIGFPMSEWGRRSRSLGQAEKEIGVAGDRGLFGFPWPERRRFVSPCQAEGGDCEGGAVGVPWSG